MLEQEYIKKFTDVVEYYQLDEGLVLDIAKAICIADNKWGTDSQKLNVNRLAGSGVSYFSGLSSINTPARPLPDVQVLRVLCDTLFLGIYIKSNTRIPDTYLTCKSSARVQFKDTGSHFSVETMDYADEATCKKYLDLFADSCSCDYDYNIIIATLNKYADKMNSIFSYNNLYKINRNIRDIKLPAGIRSDIDKRIKTDCFDFIQDREFNKYLSRNNLSSQSYCDLLLTALFSTACQNIVTKLEGIEKTNNPLCCAVCIKIMKVLGDTKLYTPVQSESSITSIYTKARTKVLKEYLGSIFENVGVVLNNKSLGQFDKLYEVCGVIISRIEKRGKLS